MTEQGVLPGLWPIQGDGVLARQGDLVLLIDPAGGSFTDRLLDLLADVARAGGDGLRFTDLVTTEFDADAASADTAADQHGPAVVAFGPAGGGTAVAVYGTGWAEVTTAYGAQRLTAGEPYARLRCVLPSTLIMVRAGVRPVADDAATDPYLRLAGGVVRAVALLYAPPEPYADQIEEPESDYHATRIESAVPAPDPYVAETPPPAPDPYVAETPLPDPDAGQAPEPDPGPAAPPSDDAAQPDFISIPQDLGEMPAVMVEGVYCKNGHFNDPEARDCAVCDISMDQRTKLRQRGARPPLGVLILSDGSVCQLDADYVIGREPTLDNAVADGHARPLRLMGVSGVVSRIHARVELDGWQVYICDLNSANGTQILPPGERNPTSLQPGVRTPLVAGTQIRLGGEYGLQYDSHRRR